MRTELKENLNILSFDVKKVLVSSDGRSIKALLKTKDNQKIETVLISPKPGIWSACISSQIGCPLGCIFCATGDGGFKRNLTSEEISDQILFWRGYMHDNKISEKFNNIIYMGMGEPFLNWEEVRLSLQDLTDEDLFGFGQRSISVSTVGVPEGIKKLAKYFPQVNLAVSLHGVINKKRDDIVPVNKRFNLTQIKKAVEQYIENTNRKVFLEYLMFDRVNDQEDDAKALVKFVKSFPKSYLLHVNLIPYNEISGSLRATKKNKIEDFKKILERNISVTIRKSLGRDIKGACGQLAAK